MKKKTIFGIMSVLGVLIAVGTLAYFWPFLAIFGFWELAIKIAWIILILGLFLALLFATVLSSVLFLRLTSIIVTGFAFLVLLLFLIIGSFNIPTKTGTDVLILPKDTSISETDKTDKLEVVDPALEHGNYPQVQIGHPNFYVETGTNDTFKWTFEVKTGEIGIVGGLVVDGKGGGVYRAYSPGKYTVKVQNGFVLTTKSEWAQNEFEFRVGQAVTYNWAYGTVDYGPLTKSVK